MKIKGGRWKKKRWRDTPSVDEDEVCELVSAREGQVEVVIEGRVDPSGAAIAIGNLRTDTPEPIFVAGYEGPALHRELGEGIDFLKGLRESNEEKKWSKK